MNNQAKQSSAGLRQDTRVKGMNVYEAENAPSHVQRMLSEALDSYESSPAENGDHERKNSSLSPSARLSD